MPLSAATLPRDMVPAEGQVGEPVIDLVLESDSLMVLAKINGKNFRKMLMQVKENGADRVAVVLQGVLLPPIGPGEPFTLAEAGF